MREEVLNMYDIYQQGYYDAVADMSRWKRKRQQRERERKACRWYFLKQKALGVVTLAFTVLAVWATEGDATIALITVPLGLCLIFSKEMLIVNNFYWQEKRRKK